MSIPYILTNSGVSVVLDGKSHTIPREDAQFNNLLTAIRDDDQEAAAVVIRDYLDTITASVEKYKATTPADKQYLDIDLASRVVTFNGEPVNEFTTKRILEIAELGLPLTGIAEFLQNLSENPSFRVAESLFEFLSVGNVPITEEGKFVTYKAVRADYTDIYSGKFDNSVGQTIEIPRNKVDENPDRTCSQGLHVCSFDYLPNFAHSNGHIVLCEVNPKDVVAIPRDYNNTKMRVSKYVVIGEHAGWYEQHREDILGSTTGYWGSDLDLDTEEEEEYEEDTEGEYYATFYRTHGDYLYGRAEYHYLDSAEEIIDFAAALHSSGTYKVITYSPTGAILSVLKQY
jgi:hypothetical protein